MLSLIVKKRVNLFLRANCSSLYTIKAVLENVTVLYRSVCVCCTCFLYSVLLFILFERENYIIILVF